MTFNQGCCYCVYFPLYGVMNVGNYYRFRSPRVRTLKMLQLLLLLLLLFFFFWPKLSASFIRKKSHTEHTHTAAQTVLLKTVSISYSVLVHYRFFTIFNEMKIKKKFLLLMSELIFFGYYTSSSSQHHRHHDQPNTFLTERKRYDDGLHTFAPGWHRTNRFTGFMYTLMMPSTLWNFVCLPVLLLSAVQREKQQQRFYQFENH